jgi:hypothetical protein
MPAGLPIPSPNFFCNGSSCYQYTSTTAARNVSNATCVANGGQLVVYNSYSEQLMVESTFKAAGVTLALDYWRVPVCEC